MAEVLFIIRFAGAPPRGKFRKRGSSLPGLVHPRMKSVQVFEISLILFANDLQLQDRHDSTRSIPVG
jgi:hypothetical protein